MTTLNLGQFVLRPALPLFEFTPLFEPALLFESATDDVGKPRRIVGLSEER
jgi:hypothetical protein